MTTQITFTATTQTEYGYNVGSMVQRLAELLDEVLPPENDDLRRTLNLYLQDVADDLEDMDTALDDVRSNYDTADTEREELWDECEEYKAQLHELGRLYTDPHLESDLAQALADARKDCAVYTPVHYQQIEKLVRLLKLLNTAQPVDDNEAR